MRNYRNKLFLILLLALVLAPGAALLARSLPFKSLAIFTSGELFWPNDLGKKRPKFGFAQIFSTETQSELSIWLAERIGLPRELYIRLNNSLDFLIGRSANPQNFRWEELRTLYRRNAARRVHKTECFIR